MLLQEHKTPKLLPSQVCICMIVLDFGLADWTGNEEDQGDVNVWEDNWDDDNVEDDFSQQLRYTQICFDI